MATQRQQSPTVLVTGTTPTSFLTALEGLGYEVFSESPRSLLDTDLFSRRIANAHFYICGGLESASDNILATARVLRAIIFLGVDAGAYFDKPAALKRGIDVYETPGANARATADQTLMLMLGALRGFPILSQALHKKTWSDYRGRDLATQKILLVGMGHIAKRVASILHHGFGCEVAYHSRTRQLLVEDLLDLSWTENLHDGLRRADIVSLHLPLVWPSPGKHFLDDDELNKMRRGSILVNTSSPHLVNPQSLYRSLADRRITMASFDGFYKEGPDAFQIEESKLFDFAPERFFMTPHTAWHSKESEQRVFHQALEIMRALRSGHR